MIGEDVLDYDFYYKDFVKLAKRELRKEADRRWCIAYDSNKWENRFYVTLDETETKDGCAYGFLFEYEYDHFEYIRAYRLE